VVLGLILAQKPDLIIFDDYSMGLDPGYRRLFIEVIRDYAADGQRSILLTSHIIQDLEGLVDDVVIYQRGKVLLDTEASRLVGRFRKFSFETAGDWKESYDEGRLLRLERGEKRSALYGFIDEAEARLELSRRGIAAPAGLSEERQSLEDIFIALTGKY
jgi:ABC-2 type transport system ATP-binding protein